MTRYIFLKTAALTFLIISLRAMTEKYVFDDDANRLSPEQIAQREEEKKKLAEENRETTKRMYASKDIAPLGQKFPPIRTFSEFINCRCTVEYHAVDQGALEIAIENQHTSVCLAILDYHEIELVPTRESPMTPLKKAIDRQLTEVAKKIIPLFKTYQGPLNSEWQPYTINPFLTNSDFPLSPAIPRERLVDVLRPGNTHTTIGIISYAFSKIQDEPSKESITPIIKELINHFPQLILPINKGNSPLALAIEHGYVDIAQLIIQKSREHDFTNELKLYCTKNDSTGEYTPIDDVLNIVSIDSYNHTEKKYVATTNIFKFALEEWKKALHNPTKKPQIESIIKLLIDNGYPLIPTTPNTLTPLALAVQYGSATVVKAIIEHIEKSNINNKNDIFDAVKTTNESSQIDKNIIQHAFNNLNGFYVKDQFVYVSRDEIINTIKMLIEAYPQLVLPSESNAETPLWLAIKNENIFLVKEIIRIIKITELPKDWLKQYSLDEKKDIFNVKQTLKEEWSKPPPPFTVDKTLVTSTVMLWDKKKEDSKSNDTLIKIILFLEDHKAEKYTGTFNAAIREAIISYKRDEVLKSL